MTRLQVSDSGEEERTIAIRRNEMNALFRAGWGWAPGAHLLSLLRATATDDDDDEQPFYGLFPVENDVPGAPARAAAPPERCFAGAGLAPAWLSGQNWGRAAAASLLADTERCGGFSHFKFVMCAAIVRAMQNNKTELTGLRRRTAPAAPAAAAPALPRRQAFSAHIPSS